MNIRQPWAVVTLWMLSTVAVVVLGVPGVLTLVARLALDQTPALPANLLGGAVLGAVLGPAQWLVLRRYISAAGWWVPASIVGLACGVALGMAAADALGPIFSTDASIARQSGPGLRPLLNMAATAGIGGAGIGLCLGGAQWLVLRREVPGAGRWLVTSALGWPAALAVGALVLNNGGLIAGLLVAGVVVGSVTGATLARLVGDGPQPASRAIKLEL